MEPKTIDCRGLVCPKPLILTRKALKESLTGQVLRILIDNATSKCNVERYLSDNGIASRVSEQSGLFTITINGPSLPAQPPALSLPASRIADDIPKSQSHVILFRNDTMGIGPEELGAALIEAFINTIAEVDPLPQAIVFYTRGVLLTIEGSPALDTLRELEELGIKLLVCGTCLNFFKVKERIKVGTVSNMFTILETLSRAGSVIEP